MNDQLFVLNALLRLARRRVPATLAELDARIGRGEAWLLRAVTHLARCGLVHRLPGDGAVAQLTLEGFALAVALAKRTAARGRSFTSPLARRAAA